jgi:hypothetical protein
LPHWEDKPSFSHYFIADEAFPLHSNVIRPYPKRVLNDENRVFNYRLTMRSEISTAGYLAEGGVLNAPLAC